MSINIHYIIQETLYVENRNMFEIDLRRFSNKSDNNLIISL